MQQLGFGFGVLDAEGNAPAFITDSHGVKDALKHIQRAKWVSVDVETTGLTEASEPVELGKVELRQDAFSKVRMRTMQARIPTVQGKSGDRMNFAFDCDAIGPQLTQQVAQALLSRELFIAHNAGFDLYWVRRAQGRSVMPKYVADTMLLTRLLQPELVLERAKMIQQVDSTQLEHAPAIEQAAWKSIITGASGGSLADVVLAMFHTVVDKTYQLPRNWTGILGFDHYEYAIDDVIWADRIMCRLLGIANNGDLLSAYEALRNSRNTVRLIEPQVPELVMLRENGMPLNQEVGLRYVKAKSAEIAAKVQDLIDLEPSLERLRLSLEDPDAGKSEDLRDALAAAFTARGVNLRTTQATAAPQVGEKDLRACRAARIEAAKPLFDAWVAVCRAKKTRSMALDVVGYAKRSDQGRLRSLMSHGPVTGRLAASEPNCQQWPRDQVFRAMCMSYTSTGKEFVSLQVTDTNIKFLRKVAQDSGLTAGQEVQVHSGWLAALFLTEKSVNDLTPEEKQAVQALIDDAFTHRIVASDFGALDVRAGAALCIRAQREMLALARGKAVPGPVQPSDHIVTLVQALADCMPDAALDTTDSEKAKIAFEIAQVRLEKQEQVYARQVREYQASLTHLSEQLESGAIQRKIYFDRRNPMKEGLLVAQLGLRLAQCWKIAASRQEREYSALRDAFIADIDIHTFTGMKLVGRDPLKEFEGLALKERKALEGKLKKELGPRRQQGKIANLSLLYGMGDAGFQEAAARNYDEHWTMEEAHDIRTLWLNAYPEVELWHLWTECLQAGVVYLPSQTRPKPAKTGWWMARTLGGRDIVAFGLNAALSYQDQSSGADILGMIMHHLHEEYPQIFQWTINQVHDEQVFCWPKEHHDEYLEVVERVMVEQANKLTMPYGVPCAVSPACGVLWIKD